MNAAPEWIQWLGAHFSPEQYLFWTRWQCLAWTLADLVIVFSVIRLANRCRSALGIRLHRFSYLVLAATVLFVPFLPFAPNGAFLFLLELFITLPHFLLLLYLCAADMNPAAKALYLWAHLVDPS